MKPASSSTLLWSYLLQTTNSRTSPLHPHNKAASSAANSLSATNITSSHSRAPLVPADKTGTSARILLHDTKANLEKFTESVHSLVKDVDTARSRLDSVSKLFERGQERSIEEMAALVNRCQVELQKSVGIPAQKDRLEILSKDVTVLSRHLESVSKEVEILHMVNQTQSQTLACLQEQQSQLLSSIAPLLPLVQAIPLHIESSRNHIKDYLDDAMANVMPRLVQECLQNASQTMTPMPRKARTADNRAELSSRHVHMPDYMHSSASSQSRPSSTAILVDHTPSSSLALLSSSHRSHYSASERPPKKRKLDVLKDDETSRPILAFSLSSASPDTPESSQEIPLLEAPQASDPSVPLEIPITIDTDSQRPPTPLSIQPATSLDPPPPNQFARPSVPVLDIPAPLYVASSSTSVNVATSSLPPASAAQFVSARIENVFSPHTGNAAAPVSKSGNTRRSPFDLTDKENLDDIENNHRTKLNQIPFSRTALAFNSMSPERPHLAAYYSSPAKHSKPMSIKERRAYGLSSEDMRTEKRFLPVTDDEDEEEDDGWDGFGF